MSKILNLKQIDYTKTKLFFDETLSIQRYDVFKYKKFYQSFLNQIGFIWRPEEVYLGGKEKNDFNSLSTHEKFIFTSNLKYQILLDSVAARAMKYLVECVSNPELEASMTWWAAFEQMHSYSYTYIIKNVYPDPSEIFDHILDDKAIVNRAVSVTKYYDDLIDSLEGGTLAQKRKKLYLALISINILEGIRFYVSFACSYCFAQNKKMEGNAKIISFINRDENLHLGMSQAILKILRTEEDEGFIKITKDCEEEVYQMYADAADEEADWARYLFDQKHGTGMLGLNAEILIRYMKWMTNRRLKGIGLKHIFEGTSNPIPWMNNWTDSKDIQEAPQETEKESYKVGSFIQDMEESDYSEYKDMI